MLTSSGAALGVPIINGKHFPLPTLFFTVRGNLKSEEVIEELKTRKEITSNSGCIIFDTDAEVIAALGETINPVASLAIYDNPSGKGHFHHTCGVRTGETKNLPPFVRGIQWIIGVTKKCNVNGCANQIAALYQRKFDSLLNEGKFPWGDPKKGESPPQDIILPENMDRIVELLNGGPNLVDAIANETLALELPPNSKISWSRIAVEPLKYGKAYLQQVLDALREFSVVSSNLARENAEIQKLLLLGVDLSEDSKLAHCYLNPPTNSFSVNRPDLHYISPDKGLFASEVDEMPGGFPEAYFIDKVYGVNQQEWKTALDWLFSKGPLLFLVSSEWSKCYITVTRWFVEELERLGYKDQVFMVTTDDLSALKVTDQSVSFNGRTIGTIWRQFPIFETAGKLVEVVDAASNGIVQLVPEFAHFGNKTWFSLFTSHADSFRKHLSEQTMGLLSDVLPNSHLVIDKTSFPFVLNLENEQVVVQTMEELYTLPEIVRDQMVMKIVGANSLTARSYGVLMGTGISNDVWSAWLHERQQDKQPFIVQRCLMTGVVNMPVFNTQRNCAEVFRSRHLLRPWEINGRIVSTSATAVPAYTRRVHGMIDMCLSPTVLV